MFICNNNNTLTFNVTAASVRQRLPFNIYHGGVYSHLILDSPVFSVHFVHYISLSKCKFMCVRVRMSVKRVQDAEVSFITSCSYYSRCFSDQLLCYHYEFRYVQFRCTFVLHSMRITFLPWFFHYVLHTSYSLNASTACIVYHTKLWQCSVVLLTIRFCFDQINHPKLSGLVYF